MEYIGITYDNMSIGQQRMVAALGKALNICLQKTIPGHKYDIKARIVHGVDNESLERIANEKIPCLATFSEKNGIPCGKSIRATFLKNRYLPSVLAGKDIYSEGVNVLKALPSCLKNIPVLSVLAEKEGSPIWVTNQHNGQNSHYVTTSIPELKEGECLFQYFNGKNIFNIIPLLLFIRSLTDYSKWIYPSLKACFIFDDPNLHWYKYGCINFAEVQKRAEIYNFHVAFAMIPLDAWFVHMPTASLFERHKKELSLLFHGNNHTSIEFAKFMNKRQQRRILNQALFRINKFELRSGLKVNKIMVPPHGACNEKLLEEMANVGFEAACISSGSLKYFNSSSSWIQTHGINPSDNINGLTVFPRFPFLGEYQNASIIGALLHQPLIPMGHHQDLKGGLEILDKVSSFINSIGNIIWTDMEQISRSHYAKIYDGNTLHVKMFSGFIEICIPEGIDKIYVEQSSRLNQEHKKILWKDKLKDEEWKQLSRQVPINVSRKKVINIRYANDYPTSINKEKMIWVRPWPIVRRIVTEVRDRSYPITSKIL